MAADVKVWDLFVRLFHWTVVIAFVVAYAVGDEALALHVWAGYLIGGLLLLRIVWGFIGPRHARFSDFIYGPRSVIGYLTDLVGMRSRRHLGHSPAGGAMVLALMIGLASLTATGLVVFAVREGAGPLSGVIAQAPTPTVDASGAPLSARQQRFQRPGREWREAHEIVANAMLILIVLHIGGVALASFAHRENLAKAMITGRKRANGGE